MIPTWIMLRHVPPTLMSVTQEIAAGIGDLIGVATTNTDNTDPRFCMALPFGLGWEPSVVIKIEHTQSGVTILIDYDNLPIRCRYCWDLSHYLKDCPVRPGPRHPRAPRTGAQGSIGNPTSPVRTQATSSVVTTHPEPVSTESIATDPANTEPIWTDVASRRGQHQHRQNSPQHPS
jgi:hypothetical protein